MRSVGRATLWNLTVIAIRRRSARGDCGRGRAIVSETVAVDLAIFGGFALGNEALRIDGFSRLAYVGRHQGITALGFEPVDRGTLLLSHRAIDHVDLSAL